MNNMHKMLGHCGPVDRNMSPSRLLPGWFVARLTVAQLVCRRVDWRPVDWAPLSPKWLEIQTWLQ